MTKLRELVAIIKDKASQGKAAILSDRATLSLLRVTTHHSVAAPSHKHLSSLLSIGDGSRATCSVLIELLMDRLQTTHNSAVALKCLIVVHHIIKYGSFILQDQLSIYPATGGRNYLNLSNFRDDSSPITWELSSWVRWYAQYIEQLLCTSRVLGFFLGSDPSSQNRERESQEERITGLLNADLLRETESLLALVEEICARPDPAHMNGNKLVEEIAKLVGEDWISITSEVSVRVSEFRERLGCLSFGEAVELMCDLKRLEECKERMMLVAQSLWDLVSQVKEKAGKNVYREENSRLVRRHRASESDRFASSIFNSGDLLRFPSGRLM
ncbi:hypothetical protein L6164_025188 [Bauhinia variegata]|uniref:Uncharacterized protein n=1 Tax=Bauhinia variegata TaxID=167791 RepID=A0ACB9LZJ8_BAUVA|nr:hypothetical protein L6164_025188 [Bauhinia variegata]